MVPSQPNLAARNASSSLAIVQSRAMLTVPPPTLAQVAQLVLDKNPLESSPRTEDVLARIPLEVARADEEQGVLVVYDNRHAMRATVTKSQVHKIASNAGALQGRRVFVTGSAHRTAAISQDSASVELEIRQMHLIPGPRLPRVPSRDLINVAFDSTVQHLLDRRTSRNTSFRPSQDASTDTESVKSTEMKACSYSIWYAAETQTIYPRKRKLVRAPHRPKRQRLTYTLNGSVTDDDKRIQSSDSDVDYVPSGALSQAQKRTSNQSNNQPQSMQQDKKKSNSRARRVPENTSESSLQRHTQCTSNNGNQRRTVTRSFAKKQQAEEQAAKSKQSQSNVTLQQERIVEEQVLDSGHADDFHNAPISSTSATVGISLKQSATSIVSKSPSPEKTNNDSVDTTASRTQIKPNTSQPDQNLSVARQRMRARTPTARKSVGAQPKPTVRKVALPTRSQPAPTAPIATKAAKKKEVKSKRNSKQPTAVESTPTTESTVRKSEKTKTNKKSTPPPPPPPPSPVLPLSPPLLPKSSKPIPPSSQQAKESNRNESQALPLSLPPILPPLLRSEENKQESKVSDGKIQQGIEKPTSKHQSEANNRKPKTGEETGTSNRKQSNGGVVSAGADDNKVKEREQVQGAENKSISVTAIDDSGLGATTDVNAGAGISLAKKLPENNQVTKYNKAGTKLTHGCESSPEPGEILENDLPTPVQPHTNKLVVAATIQTFQSKRVSRTAPAPMQSQKTDAVSRFPDNASASATVTLPVLSISITPEQTEQAADASKAAKEKLKAVKKMDTSPLKVLTVTQPVKTLPLSEPSAKEYSKKKSSAISSEKVNASSANMVNLDVPAVAIEGHVSAQSMKKVNDPSTKNTSPTSANMVELRTVQVLKTASSLPANKASDSSEKKKNATVNPSAKPKTKKVRRRSVKIASAQSAKVASAIFEKPAPEGGSKHEIHEGLRVTASAKNEANTGPETAAEHNVQAKESMLSPGSVAAVDLVRNRKQRKRGSYRMDTKK